MRSPIGGVHEIDGQALARHPRAMSGAVNCAIGVGGSWSALEESSAAGGGARMEDTDEPSVRRGERTDGAGGDGDLPGDERLHVELWRSGRGSHGAARLRGKTERSRAGSVGGGVRGKEGVGGVFTTENRSARRIGRRRDMASAPYLPNEGEYGPREMWATSPPACPSLESCRFGHPSPDQRYRVLRQLEWPRRRVELFAVPSSLLVPLRGAIQLPQERSTCLFQSAAEWFSLVRIRRGRAPLDSSKKTGLEGWFSCQFSTWTVSSLGLQLDRLLRRCRRIQTYFH